MFRVSLLFVFIPYVHSTLEVRSTGSLEYRHLATTADTETDPGRPSIGILPTERWIQGNDYFTLILGQENKTKFHHGSTHYPVVWWQ